MGMPSGHYQITAFDEQEYIEFISALQLKKAFLSQSTISSHQLPPLKICSPDGFPVILLILSRIADMGSRGMNEYWIPNHGINKKVITKEIQCYLGPEAHARPYSYEVRKILFPRRKGSDRM